MYVTADAMIAKFGEREIIHRGDHGAGLNAKPKAHGGGQGVVGVAGGIGGERSQRGGSGRV